MEAMNITIPEPALIRDRDSWRLAYLVAEVGEGSERRLLVANDYGVHLMSESYAQPIRAGDLDAALMDLRNADRDAYGRFLARMLGEQ